MKRILTVSLLLLVSTAAFAAPRSPRYLVFGRNPVVPGGITQAMLKPGQYLRPLPADIWIVMQGASREVASGIAQKGEMGVWHDEGNLSVLDAIADCGNPVLNRVTMPITVRTQYLPGKPYPVPGPPVPIPEYWEVERTTLIEREFTVPVLLGQPNIPTPARGEEIRWFQEGFGREVIRAAGQWAGAPRVSINTSSRSKSEATGIGTGTATVGVDVSSVNTNNNAAMNGTTVVTGNQPPPVPVNP